ncbi:hypothetical protein HDV05_007517 [Chytridiales sp. JEL 0842]|nr:hypothetical protein HDV05_007517 [Chytridiales sp. JEL 0842]
MASAFAASASPAAPAADAADAVGGGLSWMPSTALGWTLLAVVAGIAFTAASVLHNQWLVQKARKDELAMGPRRRFVSEFRPPPSPAQVAAVLSAQQSTPNQRVAMFPPAPTIPAEGLRARVPHATTPFPGASYGRPAAEPRRELFSKPQDIPSAPFTFKAPAPVEKSMYPAPASSTSRLGSFDTSSSGFSFTPQSQRIGNSIRGTPSLYRDNVSESLLRVMSEPPKSVKTAVQNSNAEYDESNEDSLEAMESQETTDADTRIRKKRVYAENEPDAEDRRIVVKKPAEKSPALKKRRKHFLDSLQDDGEEKISTEPLRGRVSSLKRSASSSEPSTPVNSTMKRSRVVPNAVAAPTSAKRKQYGLHDDGDDDDDLDYAANELNADEGWVTPASFRMRKRRKGTPAPTRTTNITETQDFEALGEEGKEDRAPSGPSTPARPTGPVARVASVSTSRGRVKLGGTPLKESQITKVPTPVVRKPMSDEAVEALIDKNLQKAEQRMTGEEVKEISPGKKKVTFGANSVKEFSSESTTATSARIVDKTKKDEPLKTTDEKPAIPAPVTILSEPIAEKGKEPEKPSPTSATKDASKLVLSSGISFGGLTSAATSSISIGKDKEKEKTEEAAPKPVISFGDTQKPIEAPSISAAPVATPSFTLPSTSSQEKPAAPASPFGNLKKDEPQKPSAESKPIFSAVATTSTPSFSFGGDKPKSDGDAKPLFGGFGTTSVSTPAAATDAAKPATTAEAPQFSFGGAPAASAAPAPSATPSFKLGDSKPADAEKKTEAAVPTLFNSLAGSSTPASGTSAPTFSFGTPAAATSTQPATTSATQAASTPAVPGSTPAATTGFSFGSTSTIVPSFGANAAAAPTSTSATKPTFSFGAPAAPASTTTAASTSTPAPSFSFGSTTSQSAPAPAFSALPTPAANASASFGAPTTATTAAPSTDATKLAFSFGSTAPASNSMAFGSTAPASTPFGSSTTGTAASSTPFGSTAAAPSFGAATTTTATNAAPSFSFGSSQPSNAAPAPASSGFSFGAQAPASAAPSSTPSFSFGQPKPAASTPATSQPAFSFGSTAPSQPPASQPAFGGFGQSQQSATPAFGQASGTSSTGFSFGSTISAPQQQQGFGQPSTSTAAPAFGQQQPTSTGFGFGANNNASSTPAFGQAQPSSTPFGQAQPAGPANNSFSFGQSSQPQANTGAPIFGFGSTQPAQQAAPTFAFGQQQQAPATNGSFSFGSGAQAPAGGPSFTFGAGTSNAAPSTGNAAFAFGASSPAPGGAPAGNLFNVGASNDKMERKLAQPKTRMQRRPTAPARR